ncbi:MAG: hypothetical protein WC554_12705 [Clostridia bacterium]
MNKKECKYCHTTENLVEGIRLGKIFYYPTCDNCLPKYKQERIEKRKKTTLKKYGVENIAQSKDIQIKIKNTLMDKYGYSNVSQSSIIKEKREKTNIERYGGKTPASNKDVREKMKKTSLEKYGFENPIQNKEIKQKATKTLLDKYGVDNIFKNEDFKEYIRLMNQEKYGVDFFTQTIIMKNKAQNTMLKKHGVKFHSQDPIIKKKMWETYRNNYWDTFLIILKQKYIEPLFDKKQYITNNNYLLNKYKCLRCNNLLEFSFLNPHRMTCTCTQNRSYYEDNIIDWLKTINISNIVPNEKFYENGKMKYEIDIYLPDYNMGIDFSGIYWHSDQYKEKNYHQNKYNYFKEKNIDFIQIFENEWVNKQNIVKSIISSKLGLNKKIFARKCTIKEISVKEYKDFMLKNHLQGYIPAKILIGLYFDEMLVCAASFSKYRYTKENAYEIIRFATKLEYTIIGGFGKILKYFETKYLPKKLISFVDVRYFNGKSYMNFKFEKLTNPNYFYFKLKDSSLTLHSRIKYQKHKLSSLLEKFDKNLSETENMKNNGFVRIFDAGNMKMTKTYN